MRQKKLFGGIDVDYDGAWGCIGWSGATFGAAGGLLWGRWGGYYEAAGGRKDSNYLTME